MPKQCKEGSGLAMTYFFNNNQALMENVSLQDLTPKLFRKKEEEQNEG